MSGSAGARGYLLQALVALLDSVDPDDVWEEATIEPQDDAGKVDIRWKYPTQKKVVQVKSSKNRISLPDATLWATELEQSTAADDYELRLIGPPSEEVARTARIGNVVLPTPEAENIRALVERIAHKLDVYLRAQTPPQTLGPKIREFIAEALSGRLLTHSTSGKPLTRSDFDTLLRTWIADILKERLSQTPIALPQSRNSFFYARDQLLEILKTNLDAATEKKIAGVEVLSGLGGVGKTQIAIEYAYRNWTDYSAIFFVDADTEQTLTAGFARIAEQLQLVTSTDHDPRAAAMAAKSWFETNDGWLLLFDNADDPALLRPFIISQPQGHTIVTSRSNTFDTIGVANQHYVSVLTPEESCHFLMHRTGKNELSHQEREAANAIGAELDGLPLALEQAGAYILSRQPSFASYLASLRRRRIELLERVRPITGDYAKTVATTWSLTFEAVREESEAASDVLILSAFLYSNNIPCELLVASSAELSPAIDSALKDAIKYADFTVVDDLLHPLTKYSLITKDVRRQTYSLHRLVQDAVVHELESEAIADWRRRLIRAIGWAFPEVTFDTWPICARLFNHAITVLAAAPEADLQNEHASCALHRAAHFMEEQGDYRLAYSLYHQAITARENTPGQDQGDLGTSINNLGLTLHKMGQYVEAEAAYRRALPIRAKARGEDHRDVAQTLNNLGLTLEERGRFDEAEECFHDAEKILVAGGKEDELVLATCRNNIAGLLRARGKLKESYALMAIVLEMQKKILANEHPTVAFTQKNLATFALERGEVDEAHRLLKEVMGVEEATLGAAHPYYGKSLNLLGAIYEEKGMLPEAEKAFRAAGDVIAAANGPTHPDIGMILNNLASLMMRRQKYEKAIEYHKRAEALFVRSEGEEHVDVAVTRSNMGYCYFCMGKGHPAMRCYEDALGTYTRVYGRKSAHVAMVVGNMAVTSDKLGDTVGAARYYADSFGIYEALGFPSHRDCRGFLGNYAEWLAEMGEHERSRKIVKLLHTLEVQ